MVGPPWTRTDHPVLGFRNLFRKLDPPSVRDLLAQAASLRTVLVVLYVTGFCVNCPESSDTVLHDLRETGPSFFFAPPAHLGDLGART